MYVLRVHTFPNDLPLYRIVFFLQGVMVTLKEYPTISHILWLHVTSHNNLGTIASALFNGQWPVPLRSDCGAEGSPQVTTLVEPRPRFKYNDSSRLYRCCLPLEWPPVQVPMGSRLHYYPLATCISVTSQFSSLFSISNSLKQSSCSYCYYLVTCPKYLMSKSTALPVLIQGLQFSSLTLVAFCILWSEDSHILCVPHRSIQAGHVSVVMEVMGFIENKRRSYKDHDVTRWSQRKYVESIFLPRCF
jgi:hypothetical protein